MTLLSLFNLDPSLSNPSSKSQADGPDEDGRSALWRPTVNVQGLLRQI